MAAKKRTHDDVSKLSLDDLSASEKKFAFDLETRIESIGHENVIRSVASLLAKKYKFVVVPGTNNEKRAKGNWKTITTTPDIEEFTTNQIGILTEPSDVVMVDIDTSDKGLETWKDIVEFLNLEKVVQSTIVERTCTGGLHVYFRASSTAQVRSRAKHVKILDEDGTEYATGIDTRGKGGYSRCCPSSHVPGKDALLNYVTFVSDLSKIDEVPVIPETLVDVLEGKKLLARVDGKLAYRAENASGTATPKIAASDETRSRATKKSRKDKKKADISATQLRRLVLECLSCSRATNRDEWLKVIWGIAYYDKAFGQKNDSLQLCIDFSNRTSADNKSSDDHIQLQYLQSFTCERDKVVTHRTIMSWAKDDNPQLYSTILHGEKPRIVNRFDENDKYYWRDFLVEASSVVWPSLEECHSFCRANLPRVLALIAQNSGYYIRKDSDDNPSTQVDRWSAITSPQITYMDDDKQRTLKWEDYIRLYKTKFHIFSMADVDPGNKMSQSEVFNTWYGFKAKRVEVVDMKLVQPWLDLIKDVWAAGDMSAYKYLISWIRYPLKNPGFKNDTFLHIFGPEGTGKSKLVEFLRDFVFGKRLTGFFQGLHNFMGEHVTSKAGRALWIIDECMTTGNDKNMNWDGFKSDITGQTVRENPKFGTITDKTNIGNAICLTNHKDALNLTRNQRRGSCFRVSDHLMQNQEYFGKLHNEFYNQESGNHFFTYLINLPEEECVNSRAVYHTELEKEIKDMSKPLHEVFIEEFLEQKWVEVTYRLGGKVEKEKIEFISANRLYEKYVEFCQKQGANPLQQRFFKAKVDELKHLPIEWHRTSEARGYRPKLVKTPAN